MYKWYKTEERINTIIKIKDAWKFSNTKGIINKWIIKNINLIIRLCNLKFEEENKNFLLIIGKINLKILSNEYS